MEDQIDKYFSKVVEAHKARLSLNVFLAFAMVTVTGYAIQSDKNQMFLLAALIPVVAVLVDILVKYKFISPFLYKILTTEKKDEEPIGLLYLGFGKRNYSGYVNILDMPSGIERQRQFHKKYVFYKFWAKLLFYGTGVIGEVLLWLYL